MEVVGGGVLYLSPLGVYNIHVTKLLYPGAVLEGPKQQGIRSINDCITSGMVKLRYTDISIGPTNTSWRLEALVLRQYSCSTRECA